VKATLFEFETALSFAAGTRQKLPLPAAGA